MKEETRKILISYYKWLVNLAIFIMAFAVSLVSAIDGLRFSTMLSWGLGLLLGSIFVNWLAVKRLITYSVIESEETQGKLATFFMKTLPILKVYGLLQNWLFIVGLILVALSFLLGENNVRPTIVF